MAKYSKFERKEKGVPRYKIHPVWTGIGFLMIVLVPIISWAGASELVNLAKKQGWSFMRSFPTYAQLPGVIPGAGSINHLATLPAIAAFFLVIFFILTSLLSFGYALIYRVVGPPRYSPQDEPAPRIKTSKYRR
jgi:hypothetical protein